jgi:hypothetical protein
MLHFMVILVESYVRDEILHREGVTLGLDRDDPVIKRRVRQKLEVMAEEETSAGVPTDVELSAYLAENSARFTQPAILSFEQVFLGAPAPGARDFGSKFATALEHAARRVGRPIDSAFGAHLVRVVERTPAVVPPLSAVRDAAVREWENERRHRARNDSYRKPRSTYDVVIEARLPEATP